MTGEDVVHTKQHSQKSAEPHHPSRAARPGTPVRTDEYDPFVRGRFPVGVRTTQALDTVRDRLFPCEIWYPAAAQHAGQDTAPETQDFFTVPSLETPRSQMAVRNAAARPGTYPLIIFSHPSGGGRRSATFLCTHLSSHEYVVAALDHSEVVAAGLARRDGETGEQKTARWEGVIANRVPDIRFLLNHLLSREHLFSSDAGDSQLESQGESEGESQQESIAKLDPSRIGIVGHSLGGWTALAAPEVERRIRAVVALAPGGSSQPKPGILPVKLSFSWGRDVATLYLVAENDVSLPLAGMYELFERTAATKQMVILRRADHMHFMDNVEEAHETVRTMAWTGELAWMPKEMRPIAKLCSGEQAHLFVRGLTLCHMDAILKGPAILKGDAILNRQEESQFRRQEEAQRFLAGDPAYIEAELAERGVEVIAHKPGRRQLSMNDEC